MSLRLWKWKMLRSQILLFSTLVLWQGATRGLEETCFPLLVSVSFFLHYPEMVPPQVLQSRICCCPSVAFPEFHFSCCSWRLPPSEVVKADCKNSAFVYRRVFSGQEWEENCPQGCLVTCQWHSLWQAWDAAVGAELTPTLSSVSSSPVLGRNNVFQSPFSLHWSCAPFCWFLLCCELVCGSADNVCKYII